MKLNMHFHFDEVHIDGNIRFIIDIHPFDPFSNKPADDFGFGAA